MRGDIPGLVKYLKDNGWVEVWTKNHIKLRHPVVGQISLPSTTSDRRAYLNAVALVNRKYRAAGIEPLVRKK